MPCADNSYNFFTIMHVPCWAWQLSHMCIVEVLAGRKSMTVIIGIAVAAGKSMVVAVVVGFFSSI